MIRRDPIGVVGSIAPWNYPLMMAAWKLAPALAGGNTVVLKPSEQTPLTTLKLAKTIAEIFPEGVVNVVVGRGETVGNALINHPKVAMVSLTGDIATGKKVLHAAASDDQAHPSRARRQGAGDRVRRCRHRRGGRGRQGVRLLQRRPGLHRRLPHLCRQEDLRQSRRRPRRAPPRTLKLNVPNDDENEIGPLISAAPARACRRLRRAALARRSTSRSPPAGKAPAGKGFFYEPTVVAGALQNDEIVRTRSVRPGRLGHALRRRRAGRRLGERLRLRARLVGLDRATSPRAWRRPRGCSTAAPGSTAISCW